MKFDFYTYLASLVAANKLCIDNGFFFFRTSGAKGLQTTIAQHQQTKANFLAVDDFTDGKVMFNGSTYLTRYIVTVFIFSRYKHADLTDMISQLNLCRNIRSQFISRFIKDRSRFDAVRYLNVDDMVFREYDTEQFNGLTGTYLSLSFDIPTDLTHKPDEWTAPKTE